MEAEERKPRRRTPRASPPLSGALASDEKPDMPENRVRMPVDALDAMPLVLPYAEAGSVLGGR